MRVLMVLPSLAEAKGPHWRPIKYSLFPPLGLATLAAYLGASDDVRIVDEHVERELPLDGGDALPDLVVVQVYITNAYRAYRIADHYRSRGALVALGGLHVTSLPDEAAAHGDVIFRGPGEATFPTFLADLRRGEHRARYDSRDHPRTLASVPPVRRDLLRRELYLVPNSIVVSRGCPHHCTFCYKDAFFAGGQSFYVQRVDDALAEIDRLPGRHLYFLDDHLLGDVRFGRDLFDGMRGMGRLFQGASTVDAILRGDLVERAARAGLRSIFIGFESLSEGSLKASNKRQNLGRDYAEVLRRLDDLGVMVNGSFVFGLDDDGPDVFGRTVEWAVHHGLTTATFHIATPYPGTAFHAQMERSGRMLHRRWDLFDTRHVVFRPRRLTADELEEGYWRAYREFYSVANIARASWTHRRLEMRLKHAAYAIGWKRLEPLWNAAIRLRQLAHTRPALESILSRSRGVGACAATPGSRDARAALRQSPATAADVADVALPVLDSTEGQPAPHSSPSFSIEATSSSTN